MTPSPLTSASCVANSGDACRDLVAIAQWLARAAAGWLCLVPETAEPLVAVHDEGTVRMEPGLLIRRQQIPPLVHGILEEVGSILDLDPGAVVLL